MSCTKWRKNEIPKTSTALKQLVKKLEYRETLPAEQRQSAASLRAQHPVNFDKACQILSDKIHKQAEEYAERVRHEVGYV